MKDKELYQPNSISLCPKVTASSLTSYEGLEVGLSVDGELVGDLLGLRVGLDIGLAEGEDVGTLLGEVVGCNIDDTYRYDA